MAYTTPLMCVLPDYAFERRPSGWQPVAAERQAMIIRRALVEDSPAIALVHVSTWQRAYRGMVPQAHLDHLSVADREQKWVEIFERGNSETLVADTEGRIDPA